ncbi:unnamed protein product [Ophioblennius macclurei]
MNRLLICHILSAVFCLIGAAPTEDECKDLVTPLSLADTSVLEGTGHMVLGYTDSAAFNTMLGVTQKSEINMTEIDGKVVMDEELKINGTCYNVTVTNKIEGNKSIMEASNFSAVYEMLPACEGCWIISGNTTSSSIKQMFQFMKLNIDSEDKITARAIYLYIKDPSALKDEDRERFQKQARCLGFTGDPSFNYNPDNALCNPNEIVPMPM